MNKGTAVFLILSALLEELEFRIMRSNEKLFRADFTSLEYAVNRLVYVREAQRTSVTLHRFVLDNQTGLSSAEISRIQSWAERTYKKIELIRVQLEYDRRKLQKEGLL